MFGFLENQTYPIGVDMDDDTLRIAQLRANGKGLSLVGAGSEKLFAHIKPGSRDWQLWSIEAIKKLTGNGSFKGRDIIASLPSTDVFIDNVSIAKTQSQSIDDAILAKIKPKLPYDSANALLRSIPTEQNNFVVIAAEREKIDRYLAIYEKAHLKIKSIGIWPVAMAEAYARFFGRRKTDMVTVVMLVDVEPTRTNVVICRHRNLLFARSIPIGLDHLETEQKKARFLRELAECKRQFKQMYKKVDIERLIFLVGGNLDVSVSMPVAEHLKLPAQQGDCIKAVQILEPENFVIDRRGSPYSWVMPFGLSLS